MTRRVADPTNPQARTPKTVNGCGPWDQYLVPRLGKVSTICVRGRFVLDSLQSAIAVLCDTGRMFMRRMAAFLVGLLVLLGLVIPVGAGPRALPRPQAALAVISSPEDRAVLRGQVPISGTALHPQFQRYELYYKLEPGENWVFIGDAHFEPVDRGLLGTWDTTSLPDGTYSLRLRVVRLDGNYNEEPAVVRQLLVANAQPTQTPTPEVSPTPTDTPTPPPPTHTVVVEVPVIPTPTLRPTATPSPDETAETPAGSAAEEDGGLFGMNRLISQIDVGEIGDAFVLGARYTLYAFAALAAYLILKRVVSWLWARIRG